MCRFIQYFCIDVYHMHIISLKPLFYFNMKIM